MPTRAQREQYEEIKVEDSDDEISLMSAISVDSDRSGDLFMYEVSEARIRGEHCINFYDVLTGTRLTSFKRSLPKR